MEEDHTTKVFVVSTKIFVEVGIFSTGHLENYTLIAYSGRS